MVDHQNSVNKLLASLQERAKELNCYYQVQEILRDHNSSMDSICHQLVNIIPSGWQYPDICRVKINLDNNNYCSLDFIETPWYQTSEIAVDDQVIGSITVYYTTETQSDFGGPFLDGETKLLQTICDRFSHFIRHLQTRQLAKTLESSRLDSLTAEAGEWPSVLDTIKYTDRGLYQNIVRKMLRHLFAQGVLGTEQQAELLGISKKCFREDEPFSSRESFNKYENAGNGIDVGVRTFAIAASHLDGNEIIELVQKWVQEDKLNFLVQAVNINKPLSAIADTLRRYYDLTHDHDYPVLESTRGILISLIRRFLTDDLDYVNIAKDLLGINDFYELLKNVIYGSESHGKIGGKSAGLYLATMILKKESQTNDLLKDIKVPKSWYITSDILTHFVHYSKLDDIVEQKYKPIKQVRTEYPYIRQVFKNVEFPSDIVVGLSMALDDFGDCPLVVRSSSILEDNLRAAFPGKYKSLFLANKGGKRKRLKELTEAIAEVYASTFGPDPIEYRTDRGLLDFNEEMGILIQEVVGNQIGNYFLPGYAGVAFSCNEFRWSPRIRRKDGLVRMVPGLGTRAVDRLSNDYPVLLSPGQPNLKVNGTPQEIFWYSPQYMDVINLENNCLESIKIEDFLKEIDFHDLPPQFQHIVSYYRDDHLVDFHNPDVDYQKDPPVVTFDALLNRTPFIKQMQAIMTVLEKTFGFPVDIEFASDGNNFHLLQCRPQSYRPQCQPATIPAEIAPERLLFNAHKYVGNGVVSDISHIVYVHPQGYSELQTHEELTTVGKVVSQLNSLLPKRQFVLIGPGRWGSRGDIRLGVNVDYADINNSSALIEVARQKGNYLPELSFGTHFFQDLVEAGIRYLPLYPDEEGNQFAENFFLEAENELTRLLPEYSSLQGVVKVIDVPRNAEGMMLNILMNSDINKAVGMFDFPDVHK
ncbi:MAG: pyruvate, phosphate dikinase [FCB group bacterium]|nr:pyruvate, phosphate dikinase [FCB group bacterium]